MCQRCVIHGGPVGCVDVWRCGCPTLPQAPCIRTGVHHLGLPELPAGVWPPLHWQPTAHCRQTWAALPRPPHYLRPRLTEAGRDPRDGAEYHGLGPETRHDHLH